MAFKKKVDTSVLKTIIIFYWGGGGLEENLVK